MSDKFTQRRAELASAALQTLTELGYAHTSLREIAQNSRFSHGVLHYYFTDKIDLITYCIRDFKTQCIQKYDEITSGAGDYNELTEHFLQSLKRSLHEDALLHRLWYDLRSQTMFQNAFRSEVMEIDSNIEDMIWRIVSTAIELKGEEPALSSRVVYATIDGLFQHALIRHLADAPDAGDEMELAIRRFLPIVGQPKPAGRPAARTSERKQKVMHSETA
ncbi:TetR/AcrR family transcriptional regulator [Methylopila sp. M107]|uniref:TetR/AcrR family transcriptional regulator n=1 Tax=Methylopila sp. M107 TaxID=1101190 RepID=UPI001FD8E9CA|nr:TetR/AcrR family transcriptional regulator [Methylopila sp. M107]